MEELAHYQQGYDRVVVSRDGADLVFWTIMDDNGRSNVSESRIAVVDYIAKGDGPIPWYDVGDRQAAALQIFEALGVPPALWTEPLAPDVFEMFERAAGGRASVAEVIAGTDADVVDACGATPLWYAVRSPRIEAALALIDAGADAGRRIELSARGERFTTILHEMVLLGRVAAVERALARRVDPAVLDSDGSTPMHCLGEGSDHLSPTVVRLLAGAGADVDASATSGRRPIEVAAQRLLPATVATLLDLGAQPARSLTAVLAWWSANANWYGYRRGEIVDVIEILRAGGAVVSDRDRQLATTAGEPAVIQALDAQ